MDNLFSKTLDRLNVQSREMCERLVNDLQHDAFGTFILRKDFNNKHDRVPLWEKEKISLTGFYPSFLNLITCGMELV